MAKTNPLYLIEKAIKLAMFNIWRNKVLSFATVFVIGVILFIFNVILSINFIANSSLEDLSEKVDLIVYLKESTEYTEVQRLTDAIAEIEGVEEVIYVSKEEALEDIKTLHPNLIQAFDEYDLGNPLPARFNIKAESPEYHSDIFEQLNQEEYRKYLAKVSQDQDSSNNILLSQVAENLQKVSSFTKKIIWWLILTFIVGSTLVIYNALKITIFSRKKEIQVMKLVGASHWFIRLPFVIESIIYGTLAVILSFIFLMLISQNIEIGQTAVASYYNDARLTTVLVFELIAAIVLSIGSSLIAVHKEL